MVVFTGTWLLASDWLLLGGAPLLEEVEEAPISVLASAAERWELLCPPRLVGLELDISIIAELCGCDDNKAEGLGSDGGGDGEEEKAELNPMADELLGKLLLAELDPKGELLLRPLLFPTLEDLVPLLLTLLPALLMLLDG